MRALFSPSCQVKMENIKNILESKVRGPRDMNELVITTSRLHNIVLACEEAKKCGFRPHKDAIIIDHMGSKVNWAAGYSPCITATRGAAGGHWISHLRRVMTVSEMIALMGVRPERARGWLGALSKADFGHVIGNAVHVGLLKRLLAEALSAAGLTDS